MPKVKNLEDVYLDELRDLYNMETQITKALPRMIKAITNTELKDALENHLKETEGQIDRLEQVFEMGGQKVRGKKCAAMEGILEEGSDLMSMEINDNALDAALIGGAQKVEHYEIASYGTVISWARQLGYHDQADLLEETLAEEKAANNKLTEISETVNQDAQAGESAFEMSQNGYEGKPTGGSRIGK
jgi:ferritin-like metal-binding protein YciE